MNIKEIIEKIEANRCRNVTHDQMRQLITHIKDLEHELGGLQAGNEAAKGIISMLEAENKRLREAGNILSDRLEDWFESNCVCEDHKDWYANLSPDEKKLFPDKCALCVWRFALSKDKT